MAAFQRRSDVLASLRAVLEGASLSLRRAEQPLTYATPLGDVLLINAAEIEHSGPRARLYALDERDGDADSESQGGGVRRVEMPVEVVVSELPDLRQDRLAQKLNLDRFGWQVFRVLSSELGGTWIATEGVVTGASPARDAWECRVPGRLSFLEQVAA